MTKNKPLNMIWLNFLTKKKNLTKLNQFKKQKQIN